MWSKQLESFCWDLLTLSPFPVWALRSRLAEQKFALHSESLPPSGSRCPLSVVLRGAPTPVTNYTAPLHVLCQIQVWKTSERGIL